MKRARLINIGSYDVTGIPINAKELSEQRLSRSLFRILNENVLFSIATVDPQHRAHINTAYFSYSDDLQLYFLSHPGSVHCKNLGTNSSVAMTIFSTSQNWTDPGLGVQLFGTCVAARAAQKSKAEGFYQKRFPAYANWKTKLGKDDAPREYRFYRVVTERVKVHDEKTFGDGVFVFADVRRSRHEK